MFFPLSLGLVIYFVGYQNVPLFVLLSVIRAISGGRDRRCRVYVHAGLRRIRAV